MAYATRGIHLQHAQTAFIEVYMIIVAKST